VKVQQNAMAKHGNDHRGYVLIGHVVALARERPRLRSQHDELRRADAAAVVDIFLYKVGRAVGLGPRRAHQAHNIAGQYLSDRHHSNQLLEIEQFFTRRYGLDLRHVIDRGQVNYL
jgi:hypothetical protein